VRKPGPPEKEPENPENVPPGRKLHEIRNAEKAVAKTGRAAKRPQIPAFRAENGPPDTQPENFENGGQNTPPGRKLQENRNAEKAIPKTVRAAKRPQNTAFRAETQPPDMQPENSENGGENSPPGRKLHEIRNAEKAIRKTGRATKRPQNTAFREENGPPDTQPENSENDTEKLEPAADGAARGRP